MIGTILRGINNIYTVSDGTDTYMCRIKGKLLASVNDEYNPLAVGDEVEFTASTNMEGMITERIERKNCFQRWNLKGQCNQTVVANMDLMVCVASCNNPPFRPRFIDRVITCCNHVPLLIVLNKADLGLKEKEEQRFELFKTLGFQTLKVSAKTTEGVDELIELVKNKKVAFVGQSGVGKSTLINEILGTDQRTNEISSKYNRGRHTTNFSQLLTKGEVTIVDTPGVREIMIPHRSKVEIAESFPEFLNNREKCSFDGCTHTDEPNCEIKRMVESGEIDSDRYESYLRMIDSLELQIPFWKGSTGSTSKSRYKIPTKKKKY
jgi:ribosome biogenesis GTPase